ncbi:hypothetical protein P8452_37641 [Trifolium repens]|jgi:hypothetical protein|nr:hypothetical protein QL285_088551 [Trifolium repens]KAK2396116.1 hypothetical protein QL285_057789 [Trifolium repens]KAK2403833.1 hypothetical protein QL285_053233 [Trifolium repens]KAK2440833.1 hypothetical protein QL285_012200 [Trifolium repens]WJX51442.1 hypothetical protein P8452_37641 [Trifolium repens]
MARKSSKRTTVAESNALKGKKSLGEPSRRSKRVQELKEAALKNPRLPQDSSSSDEIDEDYAEFLKTHNPQEFYHSGYTSEEEDGSLVTVEPKAKVTKSPRVQPPK